VFGADAVEGRPPVLGALLDLHDVGGANFGEDVVVGADRAV
jgi:hypothetical protein